MSSDPTVVPIGEARLELHSGDITRFELDAIVNAANEGLWGGGGVDGAFHAAAGPSLADECRRIRERDGGCATGSAVATPAGELPARYVFHAVGPVWDGGDEGEPELLAGCYRRCFELARELDVESLAFPAISTGVYGYPISAAAEIAIRESRRGLSESPGIRRVLHVLFGDDAREAFERALTGG